MSLPHHDTDEAPRPPPAAPALDRLYRAHAAAVARWAGHLAGPDADVEDLVHEVFLVAGRRLGEFRGEAKVTTWLYRITARVTAGRRRRDRVRQWLRRTNRLDVERGLFSNQPTPVEELERRQAASAVYRILDRLPERYRTLLILFELEGLPGEEIATLTGMKLATVWVQLHRSRARFLRELEREEGGRR